MHLTKEILCNAGQWFACSCGCAECYNVFNYRNEQDEWVPEEHLTPGQKAFGYAFGAVTVLNAVDAAKRSYDIAHDVIKGSNNKPDTTNKKESKNYWPILEAIFGISQFAWTFRNVPIFNAKCNDVYDGGLIAFVVGLASFTDAYFRFRGNNQIEQSPKNQKEKPNVVDKNNSQPQKSQDPEIKQKS